MPLVLMSCTRKPLRKTSCDLDIVALPIMNEGNKYISIFQNSDEIQQSDTGRKSREVNNC